MSNVFLKQILSGKTESVSSFNPNSATRKNPFLQGQAKGAFDNPDVGVNQPLHHPMFVGYRDNKAIFAGSRLFVLY